MFAVFAAMIGIAFSVLIRLKLVHLAAECWNSSSVIDPLKEALLSHLEFVHNGVSLNALLVPFLLMVFITYYHSISYKQDNTSALSLTNNSVRDNLSVFCWFKYNIDVMMCKLLKSRVPFTFILFVVGFVLHLYVTIEVVYADGDTPDNVNNISYTIHSPLEDTPSFVTSIYDYLVNWMKYYSPSRCPSNTDIGLLDSVSSDAISMYSFFSTFNLIVYILFTVTLYFVLSSFTLFFISYFSNKFTSWVGKVSKLFSGQSEADLKTVEFTKSVVSAVISINKMVIVSLFIILLVLTMYLHNYYSISTFFSTHFSEILREKYGTPMEVPIEITILGVPVHYFQKVAQIVLVIAFGWYRTYLLVSTLKSSKFFQSFIAIIIAYYFHEINGYILGVVLVDNTTTNDIPFITMCEACNASVKLLFYSLLGVLISVTLQNIIFFFKKNVISPDIHQPNLKAQNLEYYSPHLFYNILVIYLKINTSIGIIGAFQGILYLFTHFIPLS